MSRRKEKKDLWNEMEQMCLGVESLKRAIFNYFDVNDIEEFIEFLHDEGY